MNEAIMAAARPSHPVHAPPREAARGGVSAIQALLVWALTMAALYAAIPSLFADPFIRHDDYAALLGRADVYAGSTLAEGRWLNYWWAMRPALFGHQAIFALYNALWALSAALLAGAMFPADRLPWRMALASAAFAFSPPMMNTSLWPGTLVPGVALIAGYAAVIAFGSLRARIWALPVFVIPAMLSHGSFPLLMFAMALIAPGWRGRSGLVVFAVLLGISLAIGMLLGFALNWFAYGVFGVRIDDWRGATPARDLASALEMLGRYAAQLSAQFQDMTHLPLAVAAAGLGAALIVLAAVDRAAAERLLLAAAAVLGVQAAQSVATGLLTPFRGQFPLWAIFVAIPLLGLSSSRQSGRRLLFALAAAALVWIGSWHWRLFESLFPPYQAATRAIATEAASLDPAGGAALVVQGDSRELPGGGLTQSSLALQYRLEMLTGRRVILCVRAPQACASLDLGSATPLYPQAGYLRALPSGELLIRLPDTPPDKIEDPTQWLG